MNDMSSEQTEPKVWLDHAIYIWQDNLSIADQCLLILPGDATIPIDHGPSSFHSEGGADILATRYPGAVHVEEKRFQDEITHRLTDGKHPRNIFYAEDRERVKGSLTPEQLEYVNALEQIVSDTLLLLQLQERPKQRGEAVNAVYESLVAVNYLDPLPEV